MLSKNPGDIEIAKILVQKDSKTHEKLLIVARYLGCRSGVHNSDKEFYTDFSTTTNGENLYFNIHALGILKNSRSLFGETWWNSQGTRYTKQGKYYKSAIKALRELRNE